MKLKNSGKIENSTESVEFGLKWKLNLCMSRFGALQYSGEFSFLVTANEIEPCETGRMRAQWNFRGVQLPGAWGCIGKESVNAFLLHWQWNPQLLPNIYFPSFKATMRVEKFYSICLPAVPKFFLWRLHSLLLCIQPLYPQGYQKILFLEKKSNNLFILLIQVPNALA